MGHARELATQEAVEVPKVLLASLALELTRGSQRQVDEQISELIKLLLDEGVNLDLAQEVDALVRECLREEIPASLAARLVHDAWRLVELGEKMLREQRSVAPEDLWVLMTDTAKRHAERLFA